MRPFLRWTLIAALIAVSGILLVPSARADSQVERLLRRTIAAQRGVNLRGIQSEFVPSPGGGLTATTRRVVRDRHGHSLMVYTDPASQRGAVRQDDGAWIHSYDPGTHTVTVTRSIHVENNGHEIEKTVRRILAAYKVHVLRTEPVAGRRCTVLELEPCDPYGHVVTVDIDTATGVTLSRTESDRRGNTLCATFYKDVSFPSMVPERDVQYHASRGTRTVMMSISPLYHDIGRLRRAAGFEVCAPVSMPQGYAFESCEMVRLSGAPTACLRYTDGLAMVTVFEQVAESDLPGESTMVQTLPRGEAVARVHRRRMLCTVIGPREPEGILMIARAMNMEADQSMLADISRRYRMPVATLVALRNRGLCVDSLAALLELARRTGRRFEALLNLYQDGYSWSRIAGRMRANAAFVGQQIRQYQVR